MGTGRKAEKERGIQVIGSTDMTWQYQRYTKNLRHLQNGPAKFGLNLLLIIFLFSQVQV